MRKLSILALCSFIALASCQKSSVAPTNEVNSTTVQNATQKKSNLHLLTAHAWLYIKYYTNYIDSSNQGQLVYKRGGTKNTLNLDVNQVKFNTDGTVDEIDMNGNHVPGTWHFTNDEQTAYEVTNAFGTHYTEINVLSAQKFEWTGPYVHTHGVMQSVNLYFLTASTWEYIRYYTSYIDPKHKGQLVYKRGDSSNTMNLDQNRVTFNKNGTVDEIDQNGNYVSGTWSFTNAEQTAYQVINIYGTHNTVIDSLSSTRFEWTGPDVHTHGVMKPAK